MATRSLLGCIKMIILPRQARDKHNREKALKRER
eukprot:COSAG06_NODE_58860_length_276_cov_0.553672_1_plen_33_part_01